jgi:hypothetical protein
VASETVVRSASTPGQVLTVTFTAAPYSGSSPSVAFYADAAGLSLVSGPVALVRVTDLVWQAPVPVLPEQTLYLDYAYQTQVGGVVLHDREDVLLLTAPSVVTGDQPFASAADLATRLGVVFTAEETAQAEAFLIDATGLIRAFTRQTITLVSGDTWSGPGPIDQWLTLPQRPVVAVHSVTVGGVLVTDWQLFGSRLFRWSGWACAGRDLNGWQLGGPVPVLVEVVYDHGLQQVPAEVRAMALRAAARARENPTGLRSGREQIDDYTRAVEMAEGDDGAVGGVFLDAADQRILRRMFGRGVGSLSLAGF